MCKKTAETNAGECYKTKTKTKEPRNVILYYDISFIFQESFS